MKRSIKMLMLLAVLAVFVGGYFGVQQFNQTAQVTEEEGSFDLNAQKVEEVAGLTWSMDGVTYDFVNNSGTWQKKDETSFPADQDKLQGMAEDLLGVQASRKLEDVTSPADYGLAEPAFSVKVTWDDGATTTYAMGDETPFADGWYVQLSGQDNVVYTIGADISSYFDAAMTDLAVLELIPAAENVTRITVGDAFDAVYEETSLTINPDQHWYAAGQPLDGVEALVDAAQGIAWSGLINTAAADEELVAYGLDAAATALTLYDGETAAMTILIGSTNEEGDYYARLPESHMVYTVNAASLADLMNASAADMASAALLELPYDQVQAATMTVGAKAYTMVPEQIATMTDTGEALENPGKDAWEELVALTASGMPEEDAASGEVLLTVEASSISGMTAGVTISEYDAESYLYTMGDRSVLVSAAEVDQLVRAVRQIAE